MTSPARPTVLLSACLAGLCTRYDGQRQRYPEADQLLESFNCLPVCPEQLGGLSTPREAADLIGGDGHAVLRGEARVITKSGQNCTDAFVRGAREVLYLAQRLSIDRAYLKARSPSCGAGDVLGVTAALLREHGVEVSELG